MLCLRNADYVAGMSGATGENGSPRPLVPATTEWRVMGSWFLVGGVAFGIAAVVIGPPLLALVLLCSFGALWGISMYLLIVRRYARGAAVAASVAPITPERETLEETRRRVFRTTALIFGAMAVFIAVFPTSQVHHHAVAFSAPFASGASLSMGIADLAVSRWLRRWEDEHDVRILREPRYRLNGPGQKSWGGVEASWTLGISMWKIV
jgi:hypothetical protein